jgi:hypothetical protein
MHPLYSDGRTQEVFLALRELFSKNRMAEALNVETLAVLLFESAACRVASKCLKWKQRTKLCSQTKSYWHE